MAKRLVEIDDDLLDHARAALAADQGVPQVTITRTITQALLLLPSALTPWEQQVDNALAILAKTAPSDKERHDAWRH